MGCISSAPLQKTIDTTINPDDENEKDRDSPRAVFEPVQDNSLRRPFYTFSDFLKSSAEPQIFQWIFKDQLYAGNLSTIYLTKNSENDELCAAKVYSKHYLLKPVLANEIPKYVSVVNECEIMQSISHPFIMPIVEVIEDDYTNSVIIFTPMAKNGNLKSFYENHTINEDDLIKYIYEIALGMNFLHQHKIAHRDLKPENVMVFEDRVRISDFSVSQIVENESKLSDLKGTPSFFSPEICSTEPYDPFKADVWAYGVLIYNIALNSFPFNVDLHNECHTLPQVLIAMCKDFEQELVFPESDFSQQFYGFLQFILQKDPKSRPSFETILRHKLFEKIKGEFDDSFGSEIQESIYQIFSSR